MVTAAKLITIVKILYMFNLFFSLYPNKIYSSFLEDNNNNEEDKMEYAF